MKDSKEKWLRKNGPGKNGIGKEGKVKDNSERMAKKMAQEKMASREKAIALKKWQRQPNFWCDIFPEYVKLCNII